MKGGGGGGERRYTLVCSGKNKNTFCICIHTHSQFHQIYISYTQDHMHTHLLKYSYCLNVMDEQSDTHKTLYRSFRIRHDTLVFLSVFPYIVSSSLFSYVVLVFLYIIFLYIFNCHLHNFQLNVLVVFFYCQRMLFFFFKRSEFV